MNVPADIEALKVREVFFVLCVNSLEQISLRSEIGLPPFRVLEGGERDFRLPKSGTCKIRAREVGTLKPGAGQISLRQDGSDKLCSAAFDLTQFRIAEVCLRKV